MTLIALGTIIDPYPRVSVKIDLETRPKLSEYQVK